MAYDHLRNAGIVHLTFGLFSLVIGIALIAMYVPFSKTTLPFRYRPLWLIQDYVAYYVSPLYCSVVAIIAGAAGTCASEKYSKHITTIKGIVIAFSILSTLAAVVQMSLCTVFGAAALSFLFSQDSQEVSIAALTWAGVLFGFLTLVAAIVHASISCCCPGRHARRDEQYEMGFNSSVQKGVDGPGHLQ